MEKKNMVKTKLVATIFDGHAHIERRVYRDANDVEYVQINGCMAKIADLRRVNRFDVDVWYNG